MARVDPEDGSIDRGIVWWYRYDPEHRCRRNVVVAAYDDEAEWSDEVQKLEADVRALRAEGASDEKEHAGGVWKPRACSW